MTDTSPETTASTGPSGRFILRITPGLHRTLRAAAAGAGLSLNDFCARKLALPSVLAGPAAEIVTRAASLFGDALAGVIGFGSWARNELAERSDVDVLVVVESRAAITRELYRTWDGHPLCWNAHPIEPHFVHLPPAGARISGIWAEAAVDGVVLFDRDLSLSRRLVEIRRRIVAGEIVRRQAHGQSYWVEAA